MSTFEVPHLYKKSELIKLSDLHDPRTKKKYAFSSSGYNITSLVYLSNNLNQIVSRNWFKLTKILQYFGISKGLNAKGAKNPAGYKKFFQDLAFLKGGNDDQKNQINLLIKQIEKLQKTVDTVNEKIKPNAMTEQRVKESEEKFEDLSKKIQAIMGV